MAEPEWSNRSIAITLQKKRLFYQLRLTMICKTILLVFARVRVLSILDLSLLIKSGTTSMSRSRNTSLYLLIGRLLSFTGMTKKLLNLLGRSMTQDLDSERMIALNATLYTINKPRWLMLKEFPFIGRRPTNISFLFLHSMSPTKRIATIILDLMDGRIIKTLMILS
jgi:hypothetical protein